MPSFPVSRRALLTQAAALAAAMPLAAAKSPIHREPGVHVRLALNAYSFDKPLRAGTMTLEDVIHFCAKHGVDALDATGYYFTGYPNAPTDEYIYNLKRAAFLNGVQISGTGVRNDFAVADKAKRDADIRLVKNWIDVASKLGAPVIRVFSGVDRPAGFTFDQAMAWMVPALQECAVYGKKHGVIVGLQQHNDFLKTADETIQLMEAVNPVAPGWFGCVLDVGSLRVGDPYAEIEKLVPYAVSWQLKESVGAGPKQVPVDLYKVKAAIEKVGYRGVLPFEALGAGDPGEKVANFLGQIRTVFGL